MNVIRPVKMTPDMILSSTALENTEPDWLAQTTYTQGARVIYLDRKHGPSVFQSAGNENKGSVPDRSPDDWVRVGPTNRWAMFDGSASTLSESEGGFECSFRVSEMFNSVAFFEIYGTKLIVTARLSEEEHPFFTHEQNLIDNSMVVDAYTYCFSPFDYIRDGVIKGVPPFYNVIVTVSIEGQVRTGVGEMIVGEMVELGCTEYGATHGIRDYSRIHEDDFGNRYMQQGNWAKTSNLQVFVDKGKHRYVSRILTELRATPTVFIGSENPQHEPLIVFGSIKDWRGIIQYPNKTLINVEIHGLI